MADDIEFGSVEQAAPQRGRRPDRNGHFAVAACGEVARRDLPIFVDLDVMLEMESHAQSNTSVELGGVLLGRFYEDDEGHPFVIVSDSLRAEHYEATKGSFKFTHDTWSAITKRRDEFPPECEMVGWYHTHPGWGVFLSGMDDFICENFFNKQLDVALVIDPCKGDRGFFQWTGDPRQPLRRTAGFYLMASRFRATELAWAASQWQEPTMPPTISHAGSPGMPVINVMESRPTWQHTATLGLLAMQSLLMLLVAWRMTMPATSVPAEESGVVLALVDELKRERREERTQLELAANQQALNRLLEQLAKSPNDAVAKLEIKTQEAESLRASVIGHAVLEDQHRQLTQRFEASQKNIGEFQTALKDATARANKAEDLAADRAIAIASLKRKISGEEEAETAAAEPVAGWRWSNWGTVAVACGALLVAAGAALFAARRRTPEAAEGAVSG